jgi:DNA-binding NarL/FixJ family response regulator
MEETQWHNLTDSDTDRLLSAIEHQDDVLKKLIVFRSGLIPKELRWLQLKAHEFYDLLSERELQVFKLRVRSHTFPEIAAVVGVTESSCKEYWRRTIKKINAVIDLPSNDG